MIQENLAISTAQDVIIVLLVQDEYALHQQMLAEKPIQEQYNVQDLVQ